MKRKEVEEAWKKLRRSSLDAQQYEIINDILKDCRSIVKNMKRKDPIIP
jgi:hypothetical protein